MPPTDSSGTYTLPDGYQAVTGELFVATQHNSPLEDIRDALTGRLARNGSGSMSGALDMNSNRIKNLADPTSDQDAATKTYVDKRTWAAAIDIASAATTDIGSKDSETVNVTGTTTITGLGTADAGVSRWVKFAGALTLTHNATSLILPTGANITTAAGDTAHFKSEGSGNWRCYGYHPADGEALKVSETSYTFAEGSAPSTPATDKVVMYAKSGGKLYAKDDAGTETMVSGLAESTGTAPYYAARAWVVFDGTTTSPTIAASKNVTSVTKLATGKYQVTFTTAMPSANYAVAATACRSSTSTSSVTDVNSSVAANFLATDKFRLTVVGVSSSSVDFVDAAVVSAVVFG